MTTATETKTHTTEVPMTDIRVTPFTFSETEIELTAVSTRGLAFFSEMFGAGAVSVKMPKSRGLDFDRFCEQKGLSVGA